MNSYNENLHSAIVNSLQSLDIEEQDLNSQVNVAMFTLYHAQGATIATDANNAVALTLVALQSAFVAQATEMLTRYANADPAALQQLFYHAYAVAKKNYAIAEKANFTTVKQLNMAKATLNTAQVKLKSLQSGLAAANAVALAS